MSEVKQSTVGAGPEPMSGIVIERKATRKTVLSAGTSDWRNATTGFMLR